MSHLICWYNPFCLLRFSISPHDGQADELRRDIPRWTRVMFYRILTPSRGNHNRKAGTPASEKVTGRVFKTHLYLPGEFFSLPHR